jgi:transcriptional regulator with XRE-family HTH domain
MRASGISPVQFNAQLLVEDMSAKGWLPTDLAREAGVSGMTVTRFLRGDHRTPRTAKKLARALGRPVSRYLLRVSEVA